MLSKKMGRGNRMNIFVYWGNNLNPDSKSEYFISKLIEDLKQSDPNNAIYFRNPENYQFEFMTNFSQVLNNDGDIYKVMDEMKKSDVIIFISPVFAHNVSAQTKMFIDNLSSWLHTMPLIGKIGLPISISNNNGNQFVDEYLEKILTYFGAATISPISLQVERMEKEALDSYSRFIVNQIDRNISSEKNLVSKSLEGVFSMNKRLLSSYGDENAEKQEFFSQSFAKYDSITEYYSKEVKKLKMNKEKDRC